MVFGDLRGFLFLLRFFSCGLFFLGALGLCFNFKKLNMMYCQNFSNKFRRARRENRKPS